MNNYEELPEFTEGDPCPVHAMAHRKTYAYGSTMTAQTDVVTFLGCPCCVAIQHDPIGVLPGVATYHDNFNSAAGVARLRRAVAATKYA